MNRLPAIKANKLIKVLLRLGFMESRGKGSHRIFRHADGRGTSAPVHAGEDIGRGLLRAILRQIRISPEEFQKFLKK